MFCLLFFNSGCSGAVMAGYNRGEFFRYGKGELLDYIEQQNEQLSRFESRFRGELCPAVHSLTVTCFKQLLQQEIIAFIEVAV